VKRPGFLQGAAVAAVLAFVSAVLVHAIALLNGPVAAGRIAVPVVSLAYIAYLVKSSGQRTGILTTIVAWLAVAGSAWWFGLAPVPFLLLHAGTIWLVRSLYFHGSILAAVADLALCAFAIGALAWSFDRTGSVFLSTWCFFLVNALFASIPLHFPAARPQPDVPDTAAFDRARQQAEAALRQIASY